MDHSFGTLVLVAAGTFSFLTTWSSTTAPRQFAARLGLAIANAGGTNEIRAQYAGFFLAVAAVCAAALVGGVPRRSAFICLAMVFGGLIAGRLASVAIDGDRAAYGKTIRALHAIDMAGFLLAVAAMLVDRGPA